MFGQQGSLFSAQRCPPHKARLDRENHGAGFGQTQKALSFRPDVGCRIGQKPRGRAVCFEARGKELDIGSRHRVGPTEPHTRPETVKKPLHPDRNLAPVGRHNAV